MRPKEHKNMYFVGLIALMLFLVLACGKKEDQTHRQVAEQLLRHLNQQQPGSGFKADTESCLVEPADKGCYRVTFKNPKIFSDMAWILDALFKDMAFKNLPVSAPDNALIEEMVILYNFTEDRILSRSINNLKMDFDFSELADKNESFKFGDFEVKMVHASIESATSTNFPVTGLIEKKQASNNSLPADTGLKNFQMKMIGVDGNGVNQSALLEVGKISNIKRGVDDPYIDLYTFKKGAPPPDLRKTLEKGLAVTDTSSKLEKIRITIKKGEIETGAGYLDSFLFSQFIKPDKSGSFFNFGYKIGLANLRLSYQDKKEIEVLSAIKKLNAVLAMEQLSPEAVMAIINMKKKAFELREQADNPNMSDITLQLMMLFTEMVKSDPKITLSIAPLVHSMGTLELDGDVRKLSLASWPDAKIILNIPKIDTTLQNIANTELVPPDKFKQLEEIIDNLFVKTENGAARITIESKSDQRGKYFINGKAYNTKALSDSQS